jgi:hypothetical protein
MNIQILIMIFRPIALATAQMSLFVLVHDGLAELFGQYYEPRVPGISWGIAVNMAACLFGGGCLVAAFVNEFVLRRYSILVELGSLVAFVLFTMPYLTDRPYRTLLLLVAALTGLLIPFILLRTIPRKNAKEGTSNSSTRLP